MRYAEVPVRRLVSTREKQAFDARPGDTHCVADHLFPYFAVAAAITKLMDLACAKLIS